MRRRDFIKGSALAGGALLSPEGPRAFASDTTSGLQAPIQPMPLPKTVMLDLSPARWIWYPSERALQNTFVLFRRPLDLPEKPLRAKGWIAADGRYRLEGPQVFYYENGRKQWEASFQAGRRVGTETWWNDAGRKLWERTYTANGEWTWKLYDAAGHVTAESHWKGKLLLDAKTD